jgi:uncharacterized protein (TIGR00369 family)
MVEKVESKFPVPGSRLLVLGSQFLVLGSWFLVLGSWFLVPGSRFSVLGSRFLVLGSRFLVPGSRFLVLGSWFLVLTMSTPDLSQLTSGGLASRLGIEIVELSPQRIVATMPVTPDHHQPLGYLHGGASLVLAETVASIGAFFNCPPGKASFGLEINANHLRPKRDGRVTATGTPLHIGKSTQVWDVRIVDEQERLICISRCTIAMVDLAQAMER